MSKLSNPEVKELSKKLIEDFKKQLGSTTEKIEGPLKKIDILNIDLESGTVPIEHLLSEFSKVNNEVVQILAEPFESLYSSSII